MRIPGMRFYGLLVILSASGCFSGPSSSCISDGAASGSGLCDRVAAAMSFSAKKPWGCFSSAEKPELDYNWEWQTAAPVATRAEAVMPTLEASRLAALLHDSHFTEIQPASSSNAPMSFRIAAINGAAMSNFNQLNAAATAERNAGNNFAVSLVAEGPAESASRTIHVDRAKLLALAQAAACSETGLRVTEDGNPWLLIRDDGVRCLVMARVERRRHMLHLAVSLSTCWGSAANLPGEIEVSCDDHTLNCLTVAESLDCLYSRPSQPNVDDSQKLDGHSFLAVSEREDYLIPSNYKRLQQEFDQAQAAREVMARPVAPAFAAVPGIAYPGSAVLGDARALAGFLLQRQVIQVGEPERTGWLVFSGEALRRGKTLRVTIDLGHGPRTLIFKMPNASE